MNNIIIKSIICVFLFCGSVVSAINAGAAVQQNDTIWICDIPELEGKQIYGNVIFNSSHESTGKTYGGEITDTRNYLREKYNTIDNNGLMVNRDPQKGLYFFGKQGSLPKSITVFLAKPEEKTNKSNQKYIDYVAGEELTVNLPTSELPHSDSTEEAQEQSDTATSAGSSTDFSKSPKEGNTWPTYVLIILGLLGVILLGIFLCGYFFYLISDRLSKIEKDIIGFVKKKDQGTITSSLMGVLKKEDLDELKQMLVSAKQELIQKMPKQSDLKGDTKSIECSHESIKPIIRHESPQTRNVVNEFLGYAEMTLENYLTRISSNEMAVFEISQKNDKIVFDLVSNPTIREQLTSRGDILRKMRENGIIDFDDEDLNGARNTDSRESGILKVGQTPDTYVPLSPLKLKFIK